MIYRTGCRPFCVKQKKSAYLIDSHTAASAAGKPDFKNRNFRGWQDMIDRKEILNNKKRIVIKVGTTTITYSETGNINLEKLEKFVRILINLLNKG